MNKEEIYMKLNEVFRDVFDDETIVVNENTTADDIEDWDSLEHINLLAAIEQEFGMTFSMGQVVTMKNVGEIQGKMFNCQILIFLVLKSFKCYFYIFVYNLWVKKI